jgi:hypothetical protein
VYCAERRRLGARLSRALRAVGNPDRGRAPRLLGRMFRSRPQAALLPSDTLGPQLGSAGCRINPTQIGPAVELGQGVEEHRGRVGLKGRRDIVGAARRP